MAYGDGGGAEGYLVGEENRGLAAMFTMMNNARIGVGIQGLGLMERSYQLALNYAKTRVQGRDVARPKEPPVPIIRHPDVRRMLMLMKAQTEAARALACVCAFAADRAKRAGDGSAAARVDLLTPVVKAWLTDLSNDVTSLGVQVLGGMGYVEEGGAAQHMRDARVLAIYEGTNGIQANDLVFRKLARDEGAAFGALMAEMEAFLRQAPQERLSASLGHLREAAAWIIPRAKSDPATAAAGAAPFLRLTGNTLGGFYLIKSAHLAAQDLKAGAGDAAFLKAKIATAQFYADHILPQNTALAATVMEGAGTTMMMAEDGF
jgi:hypothetical protein